MREVETAVHREDQGKPTSGLDVEGVSDISKASIAVSAEGFRNESVRKAARRIIEEIRGRRNPRSFDDKEFAKQPW
jgi:hypothetical protein